MSEQTINPLPQATADFLTVLQTFLQNEDAQRLQFTGQPFVAAGGLHGTVAGLTATPAALTAFPGGFYITETGSITYADASTTWVIAHKDTVGDFFGYTRVPGTHYLTAVGAVAPTINVDFVRLMKVTTAGGAITAVVDLRETSPFYATGVRAALRLKGTNTGNDFDSAISEADGRWRFQKNTGTFDTPTWVDLFELNPSAANAALTLDAGGMTVARTQTFPDKSGTFAMTSDIAGSAFPAGTRLLFDNDAAPAGWTRDVTGSLDDRAIRLVVGARADGGSWTITGITAAGHQHNHDHTHNVNTVSVATFGGANLGLASAVTTGPSVVATDAATAAVTSDGTWRPLHRDVIVASKN